MSSDVLKTSIREFAIEVDTNFEEKIGVYGEDFWNGIAAGAYESDTFDFLEMRASEGSKLLIDVGSATGCMALYASALKMNVIGTEPQNLIFEALQRNVSLNPQLATRIKLLHCLVGSSNLGSERDSDFFTPGANGPLQKAIVTDVVTLESLLSPVLIEDRVSLKVDIEGAEYPLLSDDSTLQALSRKQATMYLSFHPGFSRKLNSSPGFFELFFWRVRTLVETFAFVGKLRKYAAISLLNSGRKLTTLEVVSQLYKDRRDFILSF